jgi:hypothetical protein
MRIRVGLTVACTRRTISGVTTPVPAIRRRVRNDALITGLVLLGLPVSPIRAQDTSGSRRPATIVVWVISAKTAVPIEGSRVSMSLRGDGGVTTDSVGRAILRGLARRPDMLVVKHPGYTPRSFPLAMQTEDSLELTVALEPIAGVLLDTVVTSAPSGASSIYAPGFEARRKQGAGSFLDRLDIEKRQLRTLPELLRSVSTVRLEPGRQGGRWLRSTRTSRTHDCPMMLYIDGTEVTSETTSFAMVNGRRVVQRGTSIFDSIPVDMIEAMEVYTTANVPAQFNHGESGCGVVLIWMRPNR